MSNDCFGRAFLVTVRITGVPPASMTCGKGEKPIPCSVSNVHELQERRSRIQRRMGLEPLLGSPQFNYEPFNSNSVNIRFWSWNYRGCWHQTCPPIDTRYWMALNIPHCKLPNAVETFGRPISFRCLNIFLSLGNLRACCPP